MSKLGKRTSDYRQFSVEAACYCSCWNCMCEPAPTYDHANTSGYEHSGIGACGRDGG